MHLPRQMCRPASGFAAPRGAPKPQLDLTPPIKNLPLPRITTAHRLARWQLERRTVGSCTRWCTSAWPNVMLGRVVRRRARLEMHPMRSEQPMAMLEACDGLAEGVKGGPCCHPCCVDGLSQALCSGIAECVHCIGISVLEAAITRI